ncbi:MAG: hypothetical protein AB7O67_04320 [Vicinamibacterales bacterium]
MPERVVFVVSSLGAAAPHLGLLRGLAARGDRVHVVAERVAANEELTAIGALARTTSRISLGYAPPPASPRRTRAAAAVRSAIDQLRLRDRAVDARGLSLARDLALRTLTRLERALPVDPAVTELLDRHRPDVVVLASPFEHGSAQVDYARAAHRRGASTLALTARWDDLACGAHLHERPDAISVWNREQRREAIDLHGMPPQRVSVLGAPDFNHLFADPPPRAEVLAALGLPVDSRLIVLSVEDAVAANTAWVAEWLRVLRTHEDAHVAGAAVLIPDAASMALPPALGPVAVMDARGARHGDARWAAACQHADAIVTTGLAAALDGAAVRVPVIALALPGSDTGEELTRFEALHGRGRGWPLMATTIGESMRHLAAVFRGDVSTLALRSARAYVRPHGPVPAPELAAAKRLIQEVARYPAARPAPREDRVARAALAILSAVWPTGRRPASTMGAAASPRVLVATPSAAALAHHAPLLAALREHGCGLAVTYTPGRERRGRPSEQLEIAADGTRIRGAVPAATGVWGEVGAALGGLATLVPVVPAVEEPVADGDWNTRVRRHLLPVGLQDTAAAGVDGALRLVRRLGLLEHAVPVPAGARGLMDTERPDVLLVLPAMDLVTAAEASAGQIDLLKAARQLGVPAAALASGGEHGVNHGLLLGRPTLVSVWSPADRHALAAAGLVDEAAVVVSGATALESFRGVSPEAVADLRTQCGLDAERDYVLYVASPGTFAATRQEVRLADSFVDALRTSGDSRLRDLAVVIRPAPGRTAEWDASGIADRDGVVLWPTSYPADGRGDDALLYASVAGARAVVGGHVTALLGAVAAGRPAILALPPASPAAPVAKPLTWLLRANGGGLRHGASASALLDELREALADPAGEVARLTGYAGEALWPPVPGGDVDALATRLISLRGRGRARSLAARAAGLALLPVVLLLAGGVAVRGRMAGDARLAAARKSARQSLHHLRKGAGHAGRTGGERLRRLARQITRIPRQARYHVGTFVRGRGVK